MIYAFSDNYLLLFFLNNVSAFSLVSSSRDEAMKWIEKHPTRIRNLSFI